MTICCTCPVRCYYLLHMQVFSYNTVAFHEFSMSQKECHYRVSDGRVSDDTQIIWLNISTQWLHEKRTTYVIIDLNILAFLWNISTSDAARFTIDRVVTISVKIGHKSGFVGFHRHTNWATCQHLATPVHLGCQATAHLRKQDGSSLVQRYPPKVSVNN